MTERSPGGHKTVHLDIRAGCNAYIENDEHGQLIGEMLEQSIESMLAGRGYFDIEAIVAVYHESKGDTE